jgi:16S rRNA (cytosine1402-N4)-methyltransferase
MGGMSRRMGEGGRERSGAERPPWLAGYPGRNLAAPSVAGRWVHGVRRMAWQTTRSPVRYGSDYHVPVMVREVLTHLNPERGGVYLDGTLGGGGHAEALLEASGGVSVIGVDRDPEARSEATRRLARFGNRVRVLTGNFADALETAGVGEGTLSGVLLDLGVSSHQVDVDERGFTFRGGAPLDMRMEGADGFETAADLLNAADEEVLAGIFYRFGEERHSRRLARVIGTMRAVEPFETSDDLNEAIGRVLPRATAQDRARIFQALRIVVNAELEALQVSLPRFREALASGGVLVVLAYHSLEDRIVKDAFREWSRACVCPPGLPICRCRGEPLGTTLTRKPVMASEDEIAVNSRARSARLRAWRKG